MSINYSFMSFKFLTTVSVNRHLTTNSTRVKLFVPLQILVYDCIAIC